MIIGNRENKSPPVVQHPFLEIISYLLFHLLWEFKPSIVRTAPALHRTMSVCGTFLSIDSSRSCRSVITTITSSTATATSDLSPMKSLIRLPFYFCLRMSLKTNRRLSNDQLRANPPDSLWNCESCYLSPVASTALLLDGPTAWWC